RRASRQLAAAQTIGAVEQGGRTVSLGDLLGPEFAANPRELFGPDSYHPSVEGYATAAMAVLPTVCAALGLWPAEEERPDASRREGFLPVAGAAAEAASEAGTEAAPAMPSGPRGPWALLTRRPPRGLPAGGPGSGRGRLGGRHGGRRRDALGPPRPLGPPQAPQAPPRPGHRTGPGDPVPVPPALRGRGPLRRGRTGGPRPRSHGPDQRALGVMKHAPTTTSPSDARGRGRPGRHGGARARGPGGPGARGPGGRHGTGTTGP